MRHTHSFVHVVSRFSIQLLSIFASFDIITHFICSTMSNVATIDQRLQARTAALRARRAAAAAVASPGEQGPLSPPPSESSSSSSSAPRRPAVQDRDVPRTRPVQQELVYVPRVNTPQTRPAQNRLPGDVTWSKDLSDLTAIDMQLSALFGGASISGRARVKADDVHARFMAIRDEFIKAGAVRLAPDEIEKELWEVIKELDELDDSHFTPKWSRNLATFMHRPEVKEFLASPGPDNRLIDDMIKKRLRERTARTTVKTPPRRKKSSKAKN